MPLSNRQKKILYWIKDIITFGFFIGMILYLRQLMLECPLCTYEIQTQYGSPLPREEQFRIMKDCLRSYNKKVEVIDFNFSFNISE